MIINFAGAATIQVFWTAFKSAALLKGLFIQYQDDGSVNTIYATDGSLILFCLIYDGVVPDAIVQNGYSQVQNDLDKADFVNNFQASSNANIETRVFIDGAKAVALGTPQLVSFSGDTIIYTPTIGKGIRLKWFAAASPDTNTATVIMTVKLGGNNLYLWPMGAPGAFSHSSIREGPTNSMLVVNLSGAQQVFVNIDIEEI